MLKKYFEAESSGIESLYNQASFTGHSVDTGSNREKILIDFLNRHLPNKFQAVKGGKIFDSDGASTKQVDIIVYDNEIPRFASQENTLYLAEGVSSAIEVKSVLDINKLREGLENLKSIKSIQKRMNISMSVGNIRRDIYCGIFSYKTTLKMDKIMSELRDNEFADFIMVNNKFLLLKNDGTWLEPLPDGSTKKIDEHYIIFENSMILYKLFLLFCKEISQIKLGAIEYDKYINIKF